MNVKCIFWGPRAPKSSQLGLLRRGCEAPFKLLCKTRKHCKKPWFLANFGSLGAWFPPPLQKKGALQPGSFYTPNHKTACCGGIFGLFFCQRYCNLSCCKLASKQNSDFMKNAQNHVNCDVKPNFGKKQLEPKSSPIAFSICFSQSSHTLHVLYQKIAFAWKAIKHCKNAVKTPFFGASSPSKNHPWNAFFSPDHKKRKGRYLRPFLILMFVPPGHKHLGKKSQKSKKSPQNILHLTLFLRIPVLPPPLTQVDGGNAWYIPEREGERKLAPGRQGSNLQVARNLASCVFLVCCMVWCPFAFHTLTWGALSRQTQSSDCQPESHSHQDSKQTDMNIRMPCKPSPQSANQRATTMRIPRRQT